MKTKRETSLQAWLCKQFQQNVIVLEALSGDAGFRCYYRFSVHNIDYIAVDAPPDKSNNEAFVNIQKMLAGNKVNVPEIIFADLFQGFLCISDLGECLLADVLAESPQAYYKQAINILPRMANLHKASNGETAQLPLYDKKLLSVELNIFTEWLLEKHLSLFLTSGETKLLNNAFDILIENALEQPQVFVHRDYHSRNIMKTTHGELALIDFQDAVLGPITYDVVSLLRDCYVRWPDTDVESLFTYFCQLMAASSTFSLANISPDTWRRWFDLMGIQRHLKASGIFARLHHRDQKSHYLADIPLTLSYLVDVCARYPELHFIYELVNVKVLPLVRTTLSSVKEEVKVTS